MHPPRPLLAIIAAGALGGCGVSTPDSDRAGDPPRSPSTHAAHDGAGGPSVRPSAPSRPATRTPPPPYVAQVRVAPRGGVETVVVVPTPAGRRTPDPELVWAEVVRARPAVDLPTLHDQLVCHVLFAPDKRAWHLEPERPDVGLTATVAAGCNPGDLPDSDLE